MPVRDHHPLAACGLDRIGHANPKHRVLWNSRWSGGILSVLVLAPPIRLVPFMPGLPGCAGVAIVVSAPSASQKGIFSAQLPHPFCYAILLYSGISMAPSLGRS